MPQHLEACDAFQLPLPQVMTGGKEVILYKDANALVFKYVRYRCEQNERRVVIFLT